MANDIAFSEVINRLEDQAEYLRRFWPISREHLAIVDKCILDLRALDGEERTDGE